MRRAVIIGLNGLSWNVLSILIDRDIARNIDDLRRGGVYSNLRSIIQPFTKPGWDFRANARKLAKGNLDIPLFSLIRVNGWNGERIGEGC